MNIQLNGEPRTLPASATLHDLLQAEQLLQRRVAVEVNGEIVSRSRHGEHVLAEGDVVEIVHALGGAETYPRSAGRWPAIRRCQAPCICRPAAGTTHTDPRPARHCVTPSSGG